jgi:hypothetical protein
VLVANRDALRGSNFVKITVLATRLYGPQRNSTLSKFVMLAARVAGVAKPEETTLLNPGQRDVPIREQGPHRQGVRLLSRYDRSDDVRRREGEPEFTAARKNEADVYQAKY